VSIVSIRLCTLLSVCLVAAACGAAAVTPKRSPSASVATPDAAAIARCQVLAERSVTPCPPANLALEHIAIHNGTHGAVSDAVARDEGTAYLREHALFDWAVRQQRGDVFLTSGALVPPEMGRTNIFRAEIKVFTDARAAGGRALIEPLTTTDITLVPVPASLQDSARRDGLEPSPYAWVDNQAGPARAAVEAPDGASRNEVLIADGQPHPILVFGQVKVDPQLGPIWYLGGEYGCLASIVVRNVCAI